jgi:MraZ protein
LRHLLLIVEHELTIDDKNSLLIPSDIRKSMNSDRDGDAFFLVLGLNRKPWLYPERYYEQMVFQAQPDITPGEEQLDFDHMNFALASRLEWDSQGRLLIPEKTLRRTELSREVMLIGARDHLEIWNRADWDARREALLARSADVAIRAKQARQTPKDQG